jgi:hypothetical protein
VHQVLPVCNPFLFQTSAKPYQLRVSHQAQNPDSTNPNEWGEFLHLPGEKFYDFNKIRAEIIKDTEAKTGKNAGSF